LALLIPVLFIAGLIAILLAAIDGEEARAGGQPDLVVTRTDDPDPDGCRPGDCSLREALLGLGAPTPSPTVSPPITPSLTPSPSPTVSPSPSASASPSPTPSGAVNGDANCDGAADMDDVMAILQHVAEVEGLPGCALSVEANSGAAGSDPIPAGGGNTIGFSIPGPGPHFIRPTTALPAIGQPSTTIDGYTQLGSSPNTALAWEPGNAVITIVLDGSLIPADHPDGEFGLWVGASGATIRGLSIVNFGDEGIKTGTFPTSALIVGNYIGVLPDGTAAGNRVGVSIRSSQAGNTVGTSSPADRNVISGNSEDGLHLWGGTAVGVRNNFVGTNPAGAAARANGGHGIHVAGAASSFIGDSSGGGNLLSGNGGDGLYSADTNSLIIAGNRAGTNAAGNAAIPNSGQGIHLAGGVSNTIGGNTPAAVNVTSGNSGSGIALSQSASNTNVKTNFIGTRADGVSPLGNSGHGVFLDSLAHDNTIGGEFNVNEQNVIAFNGQAGVALSASAGINNYIDPSKTYSNGGLGTDLLADGNVLPNDYGTSNTTCPSGPDCDTGPNSRMNYPVITEATYDGANLFVEATLTAQPDFYNIFVFLNDSCDPSGYGEGQRFISTSIGVQIMSPGPRMFSRDYPALDIGSAQYVTMSASDPESTSEFSQCVAIQGAPAVSSGDGPVESGPANAAVSGVSSGAPADADCNGSIEAMDALRVLLHLGGEDFEPPPSGCPEVGQQKGGLQGGVLAMFEVVGEEFKAWVTNSDTIQQLLDLQGGSSQANIPVGQLLAGPGEGHHNMPWSWHYDPETIEMGEAAIEVCDGLPSYVEENLQDFVLVGYCPWSAELIALQDFR
jgi:hypothetical protein